jgi:hypothetical protein
MNSKNSTKICNRQAIQALYLLTIGIPLIIYVYSIRSDFSFQDELVLKLAECEMNFNFCESTKEGKEIITLEYNERQLSDNKTEINKTVMNNVITIDKDNEEHKGNFNKNDVKSNLQLSFLHSKNRSNVSIVIGEF